jgi:uncharacterized DUF497 family protein
MDAQYEVRGQTFEWDLEKAAANLLKHHVAFVCQAGILRIISARPATPSERRKYENE